MFILRLVFLTLALLLIGFGLCPALEYANAGALAMLLLATLLIIAALFLSLITAFIKKTRLGKILFIITIAFFVFFAFIEFNIITNEFPPSPLPATDALIVLGAGLTYGTEDPSLALAYRLDAALEYLETHPDTPIIVSGGRGEIELISEAKSMQQYLIQNGIDPDQILLEDRSTTTAENLQYSAEIIAKNDWHEILIITSDYHCYRAIRLAAKNDLTATCLPAKNVWWLAPADHFREFLAISQSLLNP